MGTPELFTMVTSGWFRWIRSTKLTQKSAVADGYMTSIKLDPKPGLVRKTGGGRCEIGVGRWELETGGSGRRRALCDLLTDERLHATHGRLPPPPPHRARTADDSMRNPSSSSSSSEYRLKVQHHQLQCVEMGLSGKLRCAWMAL